ncbi:hypothetical protein GCM10011369_05380 [Neiella marina]|uniref:Uncharacterized protein n=1 Tax=Neiella marina TaxID=508461 RepID=A0A8J2U2G1_9GAMM|nr:hypothetical protein [Neiella marina]GGA66708.1 hypothetical protein GCM10011369_05380 [Neiella marina]
MRWAETIAHARLEDHRIDHRREWFFIAPPHRFSYVERHPDNMPAFIEALAQEIAQDFDNHGMPYHWRDIDAYAEDVYQKRHNLRQFRTW